MGIQPNLFFVVTDLSRSKSFYDLLFDCSATREASTLRYSLAGLDFRFYEISRAQARAFQLRKTPSRERARQGVCLRADNWDQRLARLEAAGARWEVPWGPAPWGGFVAHLSDPNGYRWELASPATLPPAPASTRDSDLKSASRKD